MKKLLTILFILSLSLSIFAQSIDEFKERRRKIQNQLPENSIVLLLAKPYRRGSTYRQSSNFYYFSGWNEPEAVLVLSKNFDGIGVESNSHGPGGQEKGLEKIKEETGFQRVMNINTFNRMLPHLLKGAETIYTELPTTAPGKPLTEELVFLNKLKERFLHLTFKEISRLVNPLRVIHSREEIALMSKAAEITDNAHLECMKAAAPGIYEYQLEALCEYVFKHQGAEHKSFSCIIGSGSNGIQPHYQANKDKLKDGDLVVIDIGARYKMYCADITRTIPVSGKFSKRQEQFYNIVLKAQMAAIEAVKPGVDFKYPDQVAFKIMMEELEKIGFIEKGDEEALRKYRKHSISHYLGLDAHDVGDWGSKLKPGMVLTIEPAIYIPEYGFGIRIEDDVLVTETGYNVLTKAPKTVKEIEKMMKGKGIGTYPLSDIKKIK